MYCNTCISHLFNKFIGDRASIGYSFLEFEELKKTIKQSPWRKEINKLACKPYIKIKND